MHGYFAVSLAALHFNLKQRTNMRYRFIKLCYYRQFIVTAVCSIYQRQHIRIDIHHLFAYCNIAIETWIIFYSVFTMPSMVKVSYR